MSESREPAVVYCEGAFATPNGKTAHGLVRFGRRFEVAAVLDARHAGSDAGEVLDGSPSGIPVLADLQGALRRAEEAGRPATWFVIGLAPDGGRLGAEARATVLEAVGAGLHVACGLHDFLSDDAEIASLAEAEGVRLVDVRKPPAREDLHFFSGKIEEVSSPRIAVLGTDSAVGKRTTAWKLIEGLEAAGRSAEMIGTGQTAWMQGAHYHLPLDALVNDFVAGEIEHAVWSAWSERSPDFIVVEGQGSLLNPAYPGGFEILAAARPDAVVLQHAPTRRDYDGFPGYPIQPVPRQIQALELVSGRPVVAVTLNHEGLDPDEVPRVAATMAATLGIPTFDVLLEGGGGLAEAVLRAIEGDRGRG